MSDKDKADRLAAKLRENLHRRKRQARGLDTAKADVLVDLSDHGGPDGTPSQTRKPDC